MKILLTFAIIFGFIAVIGFAHPTSDFAKWKDIENYLEADDDEHSYVPQADGTFRLMSHKQARMEHWLTPQPRSGIEVYFHLYTRINPTEPDFVRANSSLTLFESNFNRTRPTRIVIHGWLGSANAKLNKLIRDAYLKRGDYNIFIVDWSSAANTFNYISARYSVPDAADKVAEFVDFLNFSGRVQFKDITLVGHSLGAHVAGLAGKKMTKGTIQNIIGLDPALPLFSFNIEEERLHAEDAIYVQTIHTNGGYLSFHDPLGQGSFYPNWGSVQPGCGYDPTGACAHRRSWEYFAESLSKDNDFIPFDCREYYHLQNKTCNEMLKNIRMGGEPSDYKFPKGIFYLPTREKSPYAMGTAANNKL